jgi:uncharacterized protein YPO0396
MQLGVFSTDEHKSGFRLQYIEIFNWGTFDEYVHTIKPGGETSLLTGANGSGKTTFVDALLTLIVPEKKYRFYNQSSGSEKKGDRTEESYVMGGYGTKHTENGASTKTLYLRENKEEAYSILLAHFSNESGQAVTLFQVRYFSGGDMKRVFAVAHMPLHIEEHFRPFDGGGAWRKRLDIQFSSNGRRQIEWFDGASKYAQRLVEVLGMQSIQALSLFNQTVGIKVLGNLDEFIRLHMLEPRNMEAEFLELKQHLGTLLDAQRNIEKAEEQIRLLAPIEKGYRDFTALKEELDRLKSESETAVIWSRFTKNALLVAAQQQVKEAFTTLLQELETGKRQIAEWIEAERNTKNQIEQNQAGQRLKQLEQTAADLTERLRQAGNNLFQFREWCNTLQLPEGEVTDEAAYKRLIGESRKARLRVEREQRLNGDDEFDARNILKSATIEKETIESELNLLLHNRNNIPTHLTHLRKEICAELKIDLGDLPFAGELMQVHSDEMAWEPALEKLMHGFALRLLVPEKHYKKVNRYVNNTNLRSRLVYSRVHDLALERFAEEDTVYYKLEFNREHPLSPWVEQQVIQQFNFICLDTEKSLEKYDRAITLSGLIKNGDRHEKDDRPDRNDPGRYVMGWNNEKKKENYIKKRDLLIDKLTAAGDALERCKKKAEKLQKQVYAMHNLEQHEGFASINTVEVQRKIHSVMGQMEALKESSDQLKELTDQLEDIQQQRARAEAQREALLQRKGAEEGLIEKMQQEQLSLSGLLQYITEGDKDQLLLFQQKYSEELSPLTLETLDDKYVLLKRTLDETIRKAQEKAQQQETQISRSIHRIKNPPPDIQQRFPDWNGDVQGFSEETAHAEEFIEWLEKLQGENLPKYKKDFENYINITITYKIGGLNEEVEKWEREIRSSVVRLNQSLAGINFNRLPDTYIQLGIRPSGDTAIKSFRNNLLEALPQAANWQQSAFEEKSAHFREKVLPLITGLEENEAYRSRVLDVRNWFEFWADEKFRETDELKKTYRQMGQLSGGEKAQLTYTILCSAIAYQFGITREGKNERSLRFIAVDESFSNQDEEKATYLMELCRQLHLQLLVVTPSDKIQIVQNFIAHVHLVQRVNNRHSVLLNMTLKELKEKIADAAPTG